MLTTEQQALPLEGLTCTDAIVLLQLIGRMSANGGIKDEELTVIGTCRDNVKIALMTATGMDFDAERARQLQIIQEARRVAEERKAAEGSSERQADQSEADQSEAA